MHVLTSSRISLYFDTDLKTKQNSNFSTSLSESVWSAQLIIIFQHSSGQMRCCVLFQFSDPARSRREPQHRQTSHSEPEPDVPSHATVTSFTRRYEAGETVWLFFPSFVCWVIPPWGINDRCFYAKRGRHWREGVECCYADQECYTKQRARVTKTRLLPLTYSANGAIHSLDDHHGLSIFNRRSSLQPWDLSKVNPREGLPPNRFTGNAKGKK